jgi:hypothetical protein
MDDVTGVIAQMTARLADEDEGDGGHASTLNGAIGADSTADADPTAGADPTAKSAGPDGPTLEL